MLYRGVSTTNWDVFQNTLTEQDFINLKSLGFNTIKMLCPVGSLVTESWDWRTSYKSGEPTIDTWTRYITWAGKAGLKVIPDLNLYSVGVSSFLNQNTFWDAANYPHFANLWKVLAQKFDNIPGVEAYHILHVPGHQESGNQYEYDNIIVPEVIEAIRSVSSKKISYMPFGLGGAYIDGQYNSTGYYAKAKPLPYPNIIYCFNHYLSGYGQDYGVTHRCLSFNGDIEPILEHLEPAIAFKQKHNVEMLCGEWGLKIEECGGLPIEPSRLAFIEAQLKLFQQYGFSWVYWCFGAPVGFGGTGWSINNPDLTFRTELTDLLTKYIQNPKDMLNDVIAQLVIIAALLD